MRRPTALLSPALALLLARSALAAPPRFEDLSTQLAPPLTSASAMLGALFGGPGDLWIAGNRLFRFDGRLFREEPAPRGAVEDLWGPSPREVWAVGSVALSTDAARSAFAGLLLRFDGVAWRPVPVVSGGGGGGGQVPALHGVHGRAGAGPGGPEVFVVGEGGVLLRGGRQGFVRIESGTRESLNDVLVLPAAAGRAEVIAVGEQGTVVRGDGAGLSPQRSGTTISLRRLWGSRPDDVWAIGYDPYNPRSTILHYDGRAWRPVRTLRASLTGIWGSGPRDVWIVGGDSDGDRGVVLHYDGATWAPWPYQGDSLGAIFGLAPGPAAPRGELWVAGCHGSIGRLRR